ncbi:MAG TPA: penicillin-binding protein, partial [Gordonibacter urolithinfaciens]
MLHVIDDWTSDLPSLSSTDAFNYAQESTMYAGDQSTLLAEFQLEKRDPLASSDQVSPYVLKGTVDTEDVRFYEHTGVDLPGIARAVLVNLGGGALEGASTITQQLVRNTVLSEEANDISFERKIREAQLAVDMEKMYSKDEILLMYLNTINYGDGCYGIEAAAQNYFQVSALDLTLSQAAALVGIPQSPTYLNPKENLEACQERRNVVLDRMLTAGDITQEEHDAAQAVPLEEDLKLAPDMPDQGIYAYHHFTSYARNLLLEHGEDFNISDGNLFEGGYTIYTTLDPALQEMAEAACAAQRDRMDDDLDASLVAVVPSTGEVKAMVGGKDFGISQVNIATGGGGMGRQAGSTFKTFALTAAIESGINP